MRLPSRICLHGRESKINGLILFDCDGTLMDSLGLIRSVMGEAFQRHGFTAPGDGHVHAVVGRSLDDAVRRLLPEATEDERSAVAGEYRRIYLRRSMDGQPPLFDDVRPTLDTLLGRGYLLGIVTGKSGRGLAQAMAYHNLAHYFCVWRSSDQCPSKPHPAMVQECMRDLGMCSNQTTVVGDSHLDMQMAASCGVAAIGVSYGAQTSQVLLDAGASRVVDSFAQLTASFPAVHGSPVVCMPARGG